MVECTEVQSTPACIRPVSRRSICTHRYLVPRIFASVPVFIILIRQSRVIVDEVAEVADPGVHAGNAGRAAALAPGDKPDHVPASGGALAHERSTSVALAGIKTFLATSTHFRILQC